MDRDYTYKILRCVYNVYDELGPGLLESVYETALKQELVDAGFQVDSQHEVPVGIHTIRNPHYKEND
ncbi:MAG: GxxExxY protein [Bacteroidaceae bacterium]|nr:GxxExxY protein [Bacteroidaceae bacterium]